MLFSERWQCSDSRENQVLSLIMLSLSFFRVEWSHNHYVYVPLKNKTADIFFRNWILEPWLVWRWLKYVCRALKYFVKPTVSHTELSGEFESRAGMILKTFFVIESDWKHLIPDALDNYKAKSTHLYKSFCFLSWIWFPLASRRALVLLLEATLRSSCSVLRKRSI